MLQDDDNRAFFEDALIAYLEVDAQGLIRRVNHAHSRLIGYRAEQMIGRHVSEFLIPEERALMMQSIPARIRGDWDPRPFERRFLHGSGKVIPTEIHADIIRDERGAPVGLRSAIIDLTERKSSEALAKGVLDAAMDGLAIIDREGRILEFNRAAEQMFGLPKEAVLGKMLAETIIPPHLREQHLASVRRHLATGQRGWLAGGRKESFGLRANGKEFPVELSITRVELPNHFVFAGHMRDITDQVLARERLNNLRDESEIQRLRWETTLRQMPCGVLIVNADGKVALTNDWMRKLLKNSLPDLRSYFESDEVSGWLRSDGTPFPASEWPVIRSLKNGATIDCEELIYKVDGISRINIEVRSAPIRDGAGRLTAVGAVFLDVTKQRQAESALRLSEERYRDIFHKDVSANLIFSAQMRLLACNQAAALMFGFTSREEMVEYSAAGTFPSLTDQVAILNRLQPALKSIQHSVRLHRRNGAGLLAVGTFTGNYNEAGSLVDIHCHLAERTERRRTERKILRLTAQLINAQNEERRKLSHDLHDSTGQTLSALGMNLALLKAKWPEMPEQAAEYVTQCQSLVQDCVRDIRTVSYSLHPPLLEELGIGAALRWYVEGFSSRSAISVSIEVSEDLGRLNTEVETALFRIVQESLTNVHRHSGSKTAQIQVWRDPEQIMLRVSDEGRGIHPETPGSTQSGGGIGLASIRQQLALLNGRLEITSGPGTVLLAHIPNALQKEK